MDPESKPTPSRLLVDCAVGRSPADWVIRNGQWVCVQSGEIIPGTDVAVIGSRIAYVGPDASHCLGSATHVFDAWGLYLVPGLIDGHTHIECSFLTATEYVRAITVHGTTAVMVDPHEVANVFGLSGVKMLLDEAAQQPIHVWVQMPSCVPSAPGFETAGASIGSEQVAEAMTWPGIIGLGEVMNFAGVASGDETLHAEMDATREAGKVIGGHYASLDLGLPFHGYVAGGPEDDHEGTRVQDAVARLRQGMKVMARFGSSWHDVAAQVRAITDLGLDPRHFILVTDGAHADTLVQEGHMDRVVRHAIRCGVPALTAIQMATLNPAEHFGVSRQVGQIAPGRCADILLVGDLAEMDVQMVMAGGQVIAENGRMCIDLKRFDYPAAFRNSIHLAHPLQVQDFAVRSNAHPVAHAHVIGVLENQAPTRHLEFDLAVRDGAVQMDPARGIAKVAVVERHRLSGRVQVGFVHGFGLMAPCAIASSVAHDCHHLLVVGTDEGEMALAANELARIGGGILVMREGQVHGLVELPIAGLMSDEPAHAVADKTRRVLDAFKECGCTMEDPIGPLGLLALVVIPELRISDLGLVDVVQQRFIPPVSA